MELRPSMQQQETQTLCDIQGTPIAQARHYKIHPLREAISLALIIFIAIASTTYFIYRHAYDAQIMEFKEGLLRTAKVIATSMNGDLHETFTSPEQEKSASYKQALEPLLKAQQTDPAFLYVYTMILDNKNIPHFILDTTSSEDEKSHIMDPYFTPDAAMLKALQTQTAQVMDKPKPDAWGNLFSAYAPFYDSHHRFAGIVGIDITAAHYFARLEPIKRATIRTLMTGFFISFLIGSLIWFTRNFSLQINRRRWLLFERLGDTADYRHGTDTLAPLRAGDQ